MKPIKNKISFSLDEINEILSIVGEIPTKFGFQILLKVKEMVEKKESANEERNSGKT